MDYLVKRRISIHALREESDLRSRLRLAQSPAISIHALREESDLNIFILIYLIRTFQSTLSVRRATFSVGIKYTTDAISIHALREESDSKIQHNIYS